MCQCCVSVVHIHSNITHLGTQSWQLLLGHVQKLITFDEIVIDC